MGVLKHWLMLLHVPFYQVQNIHTSILIGFNCFIKIEIWAILYMFYFHIVNLLLALTINPMGRKGHRKAPQES